MHGDNLFSSYIITQASQGGQECLITYCSFPVVDDAMCCLHTNQNTLMLSDFK